MKHLVIFLVLIGLSGLIIPQTYGAYVEFENGKDKIVINNDHIVDFKLDWGSGDFPSGEITFDKSITDTILLQIPKSIPRTTNSDFGHFGLYTIQTDESWIQIKETESQCFYILEIPVNDSDYVEISGASVAAGRWEPVSVLNQACGEFSLKQQIENKMSALEIECKNEKHVLSERTDGKLACVYSSTAEKLNWKIINPDVHDIMYVFEVVRDDTIFDIEYEIKGGVVKDMAYDENAHSLLAIIDSNNEGNFTVVIPRDFMDAKRDYCPPLETNPLDDRFFVLLDGEEILYDEILTTSEKRTLQIPFADDVTVEIITACLI